MKPYPCGHPRTPENTKLHGRPNARTPLQACRTCRREIEKRCAKKRRAANKSASDG